MQSVNSHNSEQILLSLAEAAAVLRYSVPGLRKIVLRTKKGKPGVQIRFCQVGSGPIKFRREWLDEFIERNSIKPGQVQIAKKPPKGGRKAAASLTGQNPFDWSHVS